MRPTASALLKKARLPGLLLSNLINIRYLTGCSLSAGLLLVSENQYRLFVDDRYTEMASQTAPKDVQVLPVQSLKDYCKTLKRCGIEADDVTLSRAARWKSLLKSTKLVHISGLIEGFRRKKSPEELQLLNTAKSMTQQVLKIVPRFLKIGMTEAELGWQLEQYMRKIGGDGPSFETIVAFGTNSSRPHHRPTGKKLVKGEIVQIDCGVRYRGYCGDLSEVYFTAPMTLEQRKVLTSLKRAYSASKKLVKRGASTRKLDGTARKILHDAGIGEAFLHSLGHGVGLEVHEGVNLSSRAPDQKLEKGEVVTLEPGVYFPGKWGMRIEDMIVVS